MGAEMTAHPPWQSEDDGLRKILVTGVPVDVWEWFTQEAVRRNQGRLGGGSCGGRSSLILAAMMQFMNSEIELAARAEEEQRGERGEKSEQKKKD